MRIPYFIVTLVIFYCACQRNKTVHGMVVLNTGESTTASRLASAEPAPAKPVAQPKILIAPKPVQKNETVVREKESTTVANQASSQPAPVKPVAQPKILIAPKPVQKNETVVREKESKTASRLASSQPPPVKPVVEPKLLIDPKPVQKIETDVREKTSDSPQTKGRETVISNTKQSTTVSLRASPETAKIKLPIEPKPLVTPKSIDKDLKTSVAKSDVTQRKPKAEPDVSINLLDVIKDPKGNLTGIDANLKFCKTAACPRIYCENSLPPIPTQRICCQRCVKNPKCAVSKCPNLNCDANVIPANLTAGECCDRCPKENSRSSTKPVYETKPHEHVSGQGHSSRRPSSKDGSCHIHPFEGKKGLYKARLFHLLHEILDHLKDDGYDDSSDSDESHGMIIHK